MGEETERCTAWSAASLSTHFAPSLHSPRTATSTNWRELNCDAEACTLSISSTEKPSENMNLRFARHELIKVESVRVRNGKIRDTSNMRRKQVSGPGGGRSIRLVPLARIFVQLQKLSASPSDHQF